MIFPSKPPFIAEFPRKKPTILPSWNISFSHHSPQFVPWFCPTFNVAIETCPFRSDLPIKHGDFPYVMLVYQRVIPSFSSLFPMVLPYSGDGWFKHVGVWTLSSTQKSPMGLLNYYFICGFLGLLLNGRSKSKRRFTHPQLWPFTSYKYWNNTIYRMYNDIIP